MTAAAPARAQRARSNFAKGDTGAVGTPPSIRWARCRSTPSNYGCGTVVHFWLWAVQLWLWSNTSQVCYTWGNSRLELRRRRLRYVLDVLADMSDLGETPAPGQRVLLQADKGEVGLAHYEVRSWVGWHHHMALSLLALWFLILEKRRLGKNAGADHAAAA
jgi:hypothetical protein